MLASQGHYQVIGSRPIVKVEHSSSCVMCRRMDSSASFCAEDAEEPDKAAALSIEQQWVVRFTEPGKKTRTWVPTVEKHGPLVFCKIAEIRPTVCDVCHRPVFGQQGDQLQHERLRCGFWAADGLLAFRLLQKLENRPMQAKSALQKGRSQQLTQSFSMRNGC